MAPELTFSRLTGDQTADQVLVVGPSLGTSVAALWTRCASYLESHFEVLGWDLPGHGRSRAATAEFSMADLASSVREGADEVAEARPVWYAGVSLGGAVGLRLALDPGRSRGWRPSRRLPGSESPRRGPTVPSSYDVQARR
jgi:alpha-beta hydrolase superfamily lysophospholipase